MIFPSPQRYVRIFLYGGGSALLLLDIFFLIRAVFTDSFVPIVPILVGIFSAGGLLFIVSAEQRAREEDKRDHTRISRVAHQLENPLKALHSDLEALLENADSLPAEARLRIKHMGTKSAVLLENIRDLFLALRAQEGSISRDLRVYDVCALVKEAHQRAQVLASARNVELIITPHCKTAPVRLDRSLMLVALAHLVENAIIYTQTPGLVNIAITKGKQRVRIIVQDRGIGISTADAPLVDRPFARGHSAEQYDPDGIGLGVALSRLIVGEFGGELTWRSKARGIGSQFEISLPLHTPR